jgi:hypothetical protein
VGNDDARLKPNQGFSRTRSHPSCNGGRQRGTASRLLRRS